MDLAECWSNVLFSLQDRIRPQDVDIWFRDARLVALHGNKVVLHVPNRYYADWIRDNHLAATRAAFIDVLGRDVDVQLTWSDDPTAEVALPRTADDAVHPSPTVSVTPLNAAFTFSSFVVGECNRFAHAAAQAVVDAPATAYNPLYIYGATGLGKTHLMHAIGHEIRRRDPAAAVVYVTGEDFTNELIRAIRFKRTEEFREKYRANCSVLLVDDIQFLSGKERTQEEFFFTFNALQAARRQIVLTSDVPPDEIRALEPRLRTRFEGGLIADMQPPDHETMVAILQQKAQAAGLRIPADVADALTSSVHGSVRELEGVVTRLAALYRFYNAELSLAFCRQHLPRVFAPEPVSVTAAAIIDAVARAYNLRSADITGKRRTRALTGPRHVAMYLARLHTRLSFPELGKEFGGRDHSTIQHGVTKVEEDLANDPELATQIRVIENNLNLRHR